jgi:hypothetical protein
MLRVPWLARLRGEIRCYASWIARVEPHSSLLREHKAARTTNH